MQDALETYRTLLHLLWPMDQTGNIMGKLLIRYLYISATQDMKVKINVISDYFNTVQLLNAKRAANEGCILNFDEHEKVLKDTLTGYGLRAEVPYDGAGRSAEAARGNDRWESNRTGDRRGLDSKPKPKPTTVRPRPMVNGLRICYEFNNGKCSRTQSGAGCVDGKNDKFAHFCNVYLKDRQKYCHGKHPRSEHT